MALRHISIGDVARRISAAGRQVSTWQIRRTIDRGLLAEPERVGPYRVWSEDDLPTIEAALRAAGYLDAEVPV